MTERGEDNTTSITITETDSGFTARDERTGIRATGHVRAEAILRLGEKLVEKNADQKPVETSRVQPLLQWPEYGGYEKEKELANAGFPPDREPRT